MARTLSTMRSDARLTQSTVGRLLGLAVYDEIGCTTVSRWENGSQKPSRAHGAKLAKLFKVPESDVWEAVRLARRSYAKKVRAAA